MATMVATTVTMHRSDFAVQDAWQTKTFRCVERTGDFKQFLNDAGLPRILGEIVERMSGVGATMTMGIHDNMFYRIYPREKVNTNAGDVHLPHITYARPIALEDGEDLSAAFDPRGYPKLLRNVVARDQDAIVAYLAERNAGRTMRMLDYTEAIKSGAPRRLASPRVEPRTS
jgi:hypothetical protein